MREQDAAKVEAALGVMRGGGVGRGAGVPELVRGVGVGRVGSKGALYDGLRKTSSL